MELGMIGWIGPGKPFLALPSQLALPMDTYQKIVVTIELNSVLAFTKHIN
jgi:hypothetical protein